MNKEKKEIYINIMRKYEEEQNFSNHILKQRNKLKDIRFDENYDYTLQKSKIKRKMSCVFIKLMGNMILPIFVKICNNTKIIGKSNVRKVKGGCLTVCNHNYVYDTTICYKGFFTNNRKPWVISLEENIQMPIGGLLRSLGCVPVPKSNIGGLKEFTRAIDKELKSGSLVHIMPEGSLWQFYDKLRPFLPGAASFAVRNNLPIIPMAIGKRGETRFLKKDKLTLYIGEAIYPNSCLKKSEAIKDLNDRIHVKVEEMLKEHYTKYAEVSL